MNEMDVMRENLKLMNLRVEKMEKMIKKLLGIEENESDSYTPSSNESVDSLEFKEFSDEDIWETNENKECNECGSIDIEKNYMCEGVFRCNECNSHFRTSVNEIEIVDDEWCDECNSYFRTSVNEIDYSVEDYEWCYECERFGCKCNEIYISCEGCRNGYLNQLGHMDPGGCLYENPESIINNYLSPEENNFVFYQN